MLLLARSTGDLCFTRQSTFTFQAYKDTDKCRERTWENVPSDLKQQAPDRRSMFTSVCLACIGVHVVFMRPHTR